MNDIQAILSRLAALERQLTNAQRFGTVVKVDKGKVRVKFGQKGVGTQQMGEWLSPWIRTSMQNGFMTENVPFEEGQTVLVNSLNDDFTQATVMPYTDSEHEPMGKDASNKKHTSRIRKPREAQNDNQQQQGGGLGGGGQQERNWQKQEDDDENDNIYRRDHEGTYWRKKKVKVLFGQPEKKEGEGGQQGGQSGGQDEQERILMEVDDVQILAVKGKLTMKVGKSVYTMEDGKITQTDGTQTWEYNQGNTMVTKGTIRHRPEEDAPAKSIDRTHIHGGVRSGGSFTADPA